MPTTHAALATLALVASAHAQPVQSCYDFTPVTSTINAFYAFRPQLGGCAVAILKDGQLVYEQGFRNVTPTTVMPIASATKALSGAVLAAAIDRGELTLDDTLGDFLPAFNTPALRTISIRQAYAMTAGLQADTSCIGDASSTLASCANQIALRGLRPGTTIGGQFYYAEDGQHAVGRVLEVASGQSFITQFNTRIALPLGMTNTTYNSTTNPRIAGGASSTLRDYARFTQMMVSDGVAPNGQRVLSGAAVALMQADQSLGVPIEYAPPNLQNYAGYGLGWWRESIPGGEGDILHTDPGLFGFNPWYEQGRDLVVVLATTDFNDTVDPLVEQLKAIIRQIIDIKVDFNRDGVYPDLQDLYDFFDVFAGGACPRCRSIDINLDGVFPDNADVEAFLNVFAGDAC